MRWPEGHKCRSRKAGRPVKFSIGCNGVALETALLDKISATAANACDKQPTNSRQTAKQTLHGDHARGDERQIESSPRKTDLDAENHIGILLNHSHPKAIGRALSFMKYALIT